MTVTVRAAAHELGLSVRAVQRDLARGCAGIVRPGEPGRGKGALLDLDAYRAWRRERAGGDAALEGERDRAWRFACDAAWWTWQTSGGATRQQRHRSAELLARMLIRLYPALTGRDVTEAPPEMRRLFQVLL